MKKFLKEHPLLAAFLLSLILGMVLSTAGVLLFMRSASTPEEAVWM